jgi:hypothetical protein
MAISERELEAARTARAVRTARADARASELAPIITDAQRPVDVWGQPR